MSLELKCFAGGMIKEEFCGCYAAIVTAKNLDGDARVLVYSSVTDPQFIAKTSRKADLIHHASGDRVYVGLNIEGVSLLNRAKTHLNAGDFETDLLDRCLVDSKFYDETNADAMRLAPLMNDSFQN